MSPMSNRIKLRDRKKICAFALSSDEKQREYELIATHRVAQIANFSKIVEHDLEEEKNKK